MDANKNVWAYSEDPIYQLFGDSYNTFEPNKIQWFEDQGERIIDIKAGSKVLIVKTEKSEGGEISFYGIPRRYSPD